MSVQGYNNRKQKTQKMIQKRKKACAEFEEQIRKTWCRNLGEGKLQAAGLTSSCYCKKAGQQEMWSSFADFQASVKVLILSSNRRSERNLVLEGRGGKGWRSFATELRSNLQLI